MEIFERYRSVMVRTRLISILAAAWMLTLTVKEIAYAVDLVYNANLVEPGDWNLAFRHIISPVPVGIGFIGRLISLAKIETLPYASVATSWFGCAILLWLHFTDVFPQDGRSIYSLFQFDLLATWAMVFVFFSLLRFVITACAAVGKSDYK